MTKIVNEYIKMQRKRTDPCGPPKRTSVGDMSTMRTDE